MSSNSIYQFKPTYLYIKRHSVTGKLYFGKTVKDPMKYLGSGKIWRHHIKKHGVEHIETLWYCLFLDQKSIVEFATSFSRRQNIVQSDDWLNLQEENGLDGWTAGAKHSVEHTEKVRNSLIGRHHSEQHKLNLSNSLIGRSHSIESNDKRSKALKGRAQPTQTCPHCHKVGSVSNMRRWHFDNCRNC